MALPALRDQFALARKSAMAQLNSNLADFAKQANAAVMAYDPKPAGFIRTVDGSVGAPEEAVKPNGVIVYQYQRIEVAVLAAMDVLRQVSPVASGAYRDAHTIYVNGQAQLTTLPTMTADDDVIITNLEPYARKIEVGHMHMAVSGTDHVYQHAQQVIASRFGNQVKVIFAMRPAPQGGYVLKGSFSRGVGSQARKRLAKDTRAGAQLTYPALVFSLR